MNKGEIIANLKPYYGLDKEINLSIKLKDGETIKIIKVEFMNEKLVMFKLAGEMSHVFELDEIENVTEE